MKRLFKKAGRPVRKARLRARDSNPRTMKLKIARAFDPVAYAAALEVLG